MRFSLTPQPGESGFIQWLDAMKMVAKLQGGIPPEFRKRVSALFAFNNGLFIKNAWHGKYKKKKNSEMLDIKNGLNIRN